MKSVFLTILIFIGIFAIVKMNVLTIIDSSYFHYLAYISLAIVIICALIIVGIPKFSNSDNTKEDHHEKE